MSFWKRKLFDFQCIRIFLKLFPPLKCHTIGCSISKHLLISFSIFFFFTKFLLRQMVVPLRAVLQLFWWIIHYSEIIKTLWRWLIMNLLLFQQISLFFIAILKMWSVCVFVCFFISFHWNISNVTFSYLEQRHFRIDMSVLFLELRCTQIQTIIYPNACVQWEKFLE